LLRFKSHNSQSQKKLLQDNLHENADCSAVSGMQDKIFGGVYSIIHYISSKPN